MPLKTFETGTRNGQQTISGLISIESDMTGFLVWSPDIRSATTNGKRQGNSKTGQVNVFENQTYCA